MCKCRKLISICLISIFLFLALSMPSFADDNLINSQNFSDWEISANENYVLSYTNANGNRISLPRGTDTQTVVFEYLFYLDEDFRLNHEYNFKFKYMSSNMNTYSVSARLFVFNGPTLVRSGVISSITTPTSGEWISYDLNFVPSDVLSSVGAGYQLAIGFYFSASNINSTAYNQAFIKDIYLADLDNTNGLIDKVYNAIGYLHLMLDEAFCKIVGGTTISGVTYNGYFNDISTWLNNVKTGITDKLEAVKSGIQSTLNTVKTAITDKLEAVKSGIQNTLNTVKTAITDKLENVKVAIGDFFTMLKNYLLYFKHPVTLNNDGVPVDSQGNPVYTNPFEEPDIFETLDDWVETIDEAKETTEDSAEEGLEHISGVMGIITTLFTRVPFLSIFFGFVLAVVIIKKVTGR